MNTLKSFYEPRATANSNGCLGENGIAAFFDLDGTLLPLPSLEKRFFQNLRDRRRISVANYWVWLVEAARLLPRGINQILKGNKMYLRGVNVNEARAQRDEWQRARKQEAARGASPGSFAFYSEALERLACHAKHGHAILIVSGTLLPLAMEVAAALGAYVALSGIQTAIGVYGTRLESRAGKWTGRIAGEALFGEAKRRAIEQIAASRRFDLEKCFAYGDSTNDRGMLESVGRPAAVNPSHDLARIALRNGWPILRWNDVRNLTQSSPDTSERHRTKAAATSLLPAQSKSGNCS